MVTVDDDVQAELRWSGEARIADTPTRTPPAGLTVTCTDGYAGRVMSTNLDKSGRPCSVAVRLRGLWGRQVEVPASWMEGTGQITLRLRVERRRLLDLPTQRATADISLDAHGALPERMSFC